MSLAFSHYSIVLKKSSIDKAILDFKDENEYLNEAARNIAARNHCDGYLIGINLMSDDFEDSYNLLTTIGLKWHDNNQCIDYFIPSKGSYPADWLVYSRECIQHKYYTVYTHLSDMDGIIIDADGNKLGKIQSKQIEVSKKNFSIVAKNELNKIYYPSLVELLSLINVNNRVCPEPKTWHDLYMILVDETYCEHDEPPLPLILNGWHDSTNEEKKLCFMQLLKWAHLNKVGDIAWHYVNAMSECEWHNN